MKTKLLLIGLLSFVRTLPIAAQTDTIPNFGFENWSSSSQPTNWLVRYVTASQSTDKYAGNYALKLQTTIVSGNNDGNGTINTLPPSGTEGWQPSFTISTRHSTLNRYYKYTPLNGDSCQFVVLVFKHGYVNNLAQSNANMLVPYGYLNKGASSTYTQFTVTINYLESSVIPDSACIALSTYKAMDFIHDTESSPLGNSTLYVYKLSFDDFATGINAIINKAKVTLSPNPANDAFQITGIESTATLSLFEINGKLHFIKEVTAGKIVSVNTLPNGVYLVTIKSKNETETKNWLFNDNYQRAESAR